jgi:hypothetical protein
MLVVSGWWLVVNSRDLLQAAALRYRDYQSLTPELVHRGTNAPTSENLLKSL